MFGREHRALSNSNVPIWLITGLSRRVCINSNSPHHFHEQDKNTISCCCMGWKTSDRKNAPLTDWRFQSTVELLYQEGSDAIPFNGSIIKTQPKLDVYWTVHHLDNWRKRPTRCHLLLYYAYVRLNMFRAPLCPSSGAHDDSVGYHIGRLVLELLLVGI